jgi:hypothetical protein
LNRANEWVKGELIMPQESLTRRLRDLKVSWNSVFQLRNQFAVSTTALLYRILELPKMDFSGSMGKKELLRDR